MSAPLVVTFGEALLRLSPPRAERLRGANALTLRVGGAEANVAAGVAGLGLRARWYSRLPVGELGERALGEIRGRGVDVTFVERGAGRMGLYFLEEGVAPRATSVAYDRSHTAFTNVGSESAAAALAAGLLADANALVTSGITLALGDGSRAAAAELWRAAGQAGVMRVFDVNYRGRLAPPAAAVAHAAPFLAAAELVVVAERDALALYGGLAAVRSAAPGALVVMTRGPAGASAHGLPEGDIEQPALPSAADGRIGRGDAFLAGFLSGLLRESGPAKALALGVACASLKSTWAGDLPDLDLSEVEALAAGSGASDVAR